MNTNIQKYKITMMNKMIEESTNEIVISRLQEEVKKIEGMLALNKFGLFAHSQPVNQTEIINKI